MHDLEQELIDNSVVLSIDEHQIDVEALAYIYQWEADVLGVGADLVGAYTAATRSDSSDATSSRLTQCAGDGRVSPSAPGLTHVLDAGSGDEDSFEDFEDDCGPFYDGLNQPIADYYLNRPLQPVANGCFVSINIGPAAKGQGNANNDILIPRFPARLTELLDALEKKQNRTLKDHAVFMFR